MDNTIRYKVLSGKLAEAPSVRLDETFNPVERRNIHISGCCCGRLFKGQRGCCIRDQKISNIVAPFSQKHNFFHLIRA